MLNSPQDVQKHVFFSSSVETATGDSIEIERAPPKYCTTALSHAGFEKVEGMQPHDEPCNLPKLEFYTVVSIV